MPLSHTTKIYAVEDAKIAALTADPSGGAATYGALIDIPGIKNVGLDFDINSVSLSGDNRELDSDSTLKAISITFDHAKINLDALAVMIGGTVGDSGVTPAMKTTYTRDATDAFSYFKFTAKTPTNGVDQTGGDLHLTIFKCKVQSYSLGMAEEDYQIFSGTARGVFRTSDEGLWELVQNETAAAIA